MTDLWIRLNQAGSLAERPVVGYLSHEGAAYDAFPDEKVVRYIPAPEWRPASAPPPRPEWSRRYWAECLADGEPVVDLCRYWTEVVAPKVAP